ncbi:MAG: nicotinate-nucleotide adenylyltransferase [Peptococcaceae bacterium]|nr:nicotinate-nucleotide adenylyltransferase [Peptococcaceae bacterium]MDR2737083.1 nicotinate-nucleotide adenylyltransferase [Gracilibacteraceae bacterium]
MHDLEDLKSAQTLGIMGGTFDPIHFGHLVAAETARVAFGLDKVLFIPTGQPPHKVEHRVTDPWERFEMVKLAVAANTGFGLSRIEIMREGPSYTIDTLRELRGILVDADLHFITGADALRSMLSWREPEEIIALTKVISVSRPGYPLQDLFETIDQYVPGHQDRIFQLKIPALAISSTDIRARVQEGRPIRYLLPDDVKSYIEKRGFYRDS